MSNLMHSTTPAQSLRRSSYRPWDHLEDRWQQHRRPPVELAISQGRATQLVREVRGPVFLIGANSECDLVLGDSSFPPVHTYLYLADHGVRIRHLGAPPDVRVNGQLIDVALLETGDCIDLDPFRFRILIRDRHTGNRAQAARWN